MTRDGCSMVPLLEAHQNRRLGEKDQASLARHLVGCAECRAHVRELDEVRGHLRLSQEAPVAPLEHQRRRLALLRAAAFPLSGRPARRPWLAAFAVAVAVGLAVGVTLRRGPAAGSVPLVARLPLAALRLPERTVTTLHGSVGAHFERRMMDHMERIELTEGTLDLSVRKLAPGERFIVVTSDAEVEVRGTIFQVEATPRGIAGVVVTEGKVEVRHRGSISLVTAGGSWRPVIESAAEPARPYLPTRTAGAVSVAHPSERRRRFEATPLPEEPVRTPAPSAAESASREFAAAMGLLERGDYAAASEWLDAFVAARPADPRAQDAAFLTIVALQRAGRRTEAGQAAGRYLERYPRGDRRAEAAAAAKGR